MWDLIRVISHLLIHTLSGMTMRNHRGFKQVNKCFEMLVSSTVGHSYRRFGQFRFQLIFLTLMAVMFGVILRFHRWRKAHSQEKMLCDAENVDCALEDSDPVNLETMNGKLDARHAFKPHFENVVQERSKQAIVEELLIRLDQERSPSRSKKQSKEKLQLMVNRIDLPYHRSSDQLPRSRASNNLYR